MASLGYKWEVGAKPHHQSLLCLSCFFSFLAPLLSGAVMALIRRFSAAEKDKTPLNEPELLPPKKRRSHHREMVVRPVVSRPWYERPVPGYHCPCMLVSMLPEGEATSVAAHASAVAAVP